MKKLLFVITLIIFIAPVQANVVINEIMYDVVGSDDNHEWIEVYNNGNESVNLTNWKFFEANTNHGLTLINNSAILDASDFAVIVDDWQTFLQDYPNYNKTLFDSSFSLSNSGETIALKNSTSDIVESLTYNSMWGGNGTGKSLERINVSESSNSSSNWAESTVINGTPGVINSVVPPDHDLSVSDSEIYFSPIDPSPRTTVNITAIIRNLGANNETNVNVSFYNITGLAESLINSTILNVSRQSLVSLTINWNNTSAGNHTILVSVSNVTGETNLTNNNATKNITIKFRLVLNEIMYNPPEEIGSDADFEWIEIYNNASYNENLTGWSLKCDTETNSPKTKTLSGTLDSGKYIVLAKDTTEFYTYYSSSIQTVSETCSLNNDGEIIKLGFNDSGIYHEESVTYSSSWGADGTGYSLERVSPNESSWSESIAYGGTPGAKNNPDNKTKSSLKQTEIVYKTSDSSSSGGGSISTSTQKESDYEIVSYQPVVYVGKEFETVVSLKSEVRKNLVVYSYVFDERKLLSEGFDGTKWRKTWNANEKNLIINAGSTATLILKNKIKDDAYAGNYKLRVRILNEKDLTKDITVVLPSEQTLPILAMVCSVDGDKTIVDIRSNVVENATLMIFSEDGMKTKNITIRNQTIETIQETGGYNYIMLVQENKILDECSLDVEKPIGITGRAVTTNNLISKIYAWLKSLLSSGRRV